MRILFLHHFPRARSLDSRLVRGWATALCRAGHEARLLVLDSEARGDDTVAVRRIVCRPADPAADLSFDVPRFETEAVDDPGLTFAQLTDHQLGAYREQVRRQLDVDVDQFDPHVIHAQHIWVQAQLALETGVPYVLNAWGAELMDYAHNPRYQRWADQAAENAARIWVPNAELLDRVTAMFEAAADRAAIMPEAARRAAISEAEQSAASDALVALYSQVRDERLGRAR